MKPDLSVNFKHGRKGRIAKNGSLMVGSKFFGAALGFASLSLATNFLSKPELGVLFFIHAYMLFFSEVTAFQSWQAIIRYGTSDLQNKDSDKLYKLIGFGIRLDALAALVAFILSAAMFSFSIWFVQNYTDTGDIAQGFSLDEFRNYLILYCTLVILRQRGASIGVFRLFDKFNVLAAKAVIMPFVRLIGAVIAGLTGAGFEGFLLAWFAGSFCAYIFLPIMAIIELKRRNMLGHIIRAKVKFLKPEREGLWGFVFKSNIDATLGAATLHLPSLLVFSIFGPAWNAIYKIAEEVAKLLSEGFKLLDQVIYPELARMVSEGKVNKIWRLTTRAAAILLLFGSFMSAVFFVFGEAILRLFAIDGFEPAVPFAMILVPAAALMGAAAPLYPIFFAADRPERAIAARGLGVAIYIAALCVMAKVMGPMGAAWAVMIGNGFTVVIVTLMAKYTLEQRVQASVEEGALLPARQFVLLIGTPQAKLWGLRLIEWQTRAFKKFGLTSTSNKAVASHVFDANFVLSNNLLKAFSECKDTALVNDDVIIGVAGAPSDLIGQAAASASGLRIARPQDLVSSYDKALRKSERPYALDSRKVPVDVIMKEQFAGSYKGITDFVTKFIWPIPAYYVTRLCANLRLTPNMVTTIGMILMFAALYFFWKGQWGLGFAAGWMMTFLDTVDGKLARTTMTFSAWGNIYDHGIDLIHPPFWYWAWFIGLGGHFIWPGAISDPLTLALAAICIGYVADRVVEGIFIAQHGFHIHVWRPINSALRFVIARRNPNMFIFMIGIILSNIWPQAGVWSFYVIAIWTWVCIAFNIGVVIIGSFKRGKINSWMDPV